MSDPHFDAQEDWVAATVVAMQAGCPIVEGRELYRHWRARIEAEGVEALFESALHAQKLRNAGLGEDIPFCAQVDITTAVPEAAARHPLGVLLRHAG
jgi:phosphosulfolactate phosphohydrolase-like enzyme